MQFAFSDQKTAPYAKASLKEIQVESEIWGTDRTAEFPSQWWTVWVQWLRESGSEVFIRISDHFSWPAKRHWHDKILNPVIVTLLLDTIMEYLGSVTSFFFTKSAYIYDCKCRWKEWEINLWVKLMGMSGNLQTCVTGKNEDVIPSWKNMIFHSSHFSPCGDGIL